MAHSSTVFLTHSPGSSDETEIEINGPVSSDVEWLPQWVTGQTADGTRVVYRGTASQVSVWTLEFDSLTAAQRNALASFFLNTAKGAEETWRYTHTDGEAWNGVRFLDTALRWQRLNNNLWGVTVRLELYEDVDS